MVSLPKAITFDCYGTLIDWESAIRRFFAESIEAKGYGYVTSQTLQEEWEEIQFHYIQQQYRPYRQVLRDTLRMVFDRYDIPTDDEECDEFADAMATGNHFPIPEMPCSKYSGVPKLFLLPTPMTRSLRKRSALSA